jgi:hypothetical protein
MAEHARNPLDDQLVHIATMLAVSDLARSRAFYCDTLGFAVHLSWPRSPACSVHKIKRQAAARS